MVARYGGPVDDARAFQRFRRGATAAAIPAAVMLSVSAGLPGCVAYPATRTYFAPDPADGTPTASMACGWHATRNDSLLREADGVVIQVSPRFVAGKPLTVAVLVASAEATTASDPAQLRLRVAPGTVPLGPVSVQTVVQDAGRSPTGAPPAPGQAVATRPATQTWYTLTFPVASDGLTAITIEFAAGAVRVGGEPRPVAPFRFQRVVRRDWYYGSLNC